LAPESQDNQYASGPKDTFTLPSTCEHIAPNTSTDLLSRARNFSSEASPAFVFGKNMEVVMLTIFPLASLLPSRKVTSITFLSPLLVVTLRCFSPVCMSARKSIFC
jgi:hypothetical protein